MKYNKKFIIVSAIVGSAGLAGIGATALAATNTNATNYPSIVQKIASTFGLDPAKVNDVFKQQRQDNRADRQAKLKASLDQAVKDGKLTQDQATKLLAELKSLHQQAKTDRQSLKTQLDQWAKDNGITNLSEILPAPNRPHHALGMMPDNDGNADDSGSLGATTQ